MSENITEAEESLNYYNGSTQARICTPAYERIMQLYAFGHTNIEILSIINTEFQDILVNPIGVEGLKNIISSNKGEFDRVRNAMGMTFREEIQRTLQVMHNKTARVEMRMVEVYVEKIETLVEEFASLNPSEKDEDGNFINTGRIFVVSEMIAKFHKQCEHITGTNTLREIEAFRMKAAIKAELDGDKNNLNPSYEQPTTMGKTSKTPGVMLEV